jgi:hypothetical protein
VGTISGSSRVYEADYGVYGRDTALFSPLNYDNVINGEFGQESADLFG